MSRALGVLAMLLVAVTGCSSDCQSICEEWVEEDCCDENDFGEGCTDDVDDCEGDCEDEEELVEESGCEEEIEALNDCTSDLDDICDAGSICEIDTKGGSWSCNGDCGSEQEDFSECVQDFCADNPDNNVCN